MNITTLILTVLISSFSAVGIAFLCRFAYPAIPSKWLEEDVLTIEDGLLMVNRITSNLNARIGRYFFWTLFLPACVTFTPLIHLGYGTSFATLALLLALALCLIISTCDITCQILPDQLTVLLLLPAVILALGHFVFRESMVYTNPYSPLIGALIGGGILLLISLLGKLVYKKEAVGFGDVKLLAVLGLSLGAKYTIVAFFIMLIAAFIHCIIILATKKAKKDGCIPLAPYICLGFFITVCFKNQIDLLLNLYFSLFS